MKPEWGQGSWEIGGIKLSNRAQLGISGLIKGTNTRFSRTHTKQLFFDSLTAHIQSPGHYIMMTRLAYGRSWSSIEQWMTASKKTRPQTTSDEHLCEKIETIDRGMAIEIETFNCKDSSLLFFQYWGAIELTLQTFNKDWVRVAYVHDIVFRWFIILF